MIRIRLPYFYQLAEALEPIFTISAGAKHHDVLYPPFHLRTALERLLGSGSLYAPVLRSCRESGEALFSAINTIVNDTADREFSLSETFPLNHSANEYKVAMLAELGVVPAYFVTPKEGFDTLVLLGEGDKLFPSDLSAKVPEAVCDITEAGKALAYELPTSVGFHVFRATESVLRRYYSLQTNGAAPPKVRSIAVYARKMRDTRCGDDMILFVLEQIAKLHRNPLIHPEVVLTMDEAIATIGIARSAVTAMLKVLPTVPLTTTTPAATTA